jgi:hypothetical protein
MSHLFTIVEANRLVPAVRTLVERLVELQRANAEVDQDLTNISQKVMFTGGTDLPRERLFELKQDREQLQDDIQETLDKLRQLGCVVKDVEEGLVDFPTLYRGEPVYLCWRLGEDSIRFWHTVAEGIAGRKQIDDDFLKLHSGDEAQKQG